MRKIGPVNVTALAVAAIAAAPAAASTPEPVQFERSAPAAVRASAAGPRKIEGLVRTGRHFNMVGLHWTGDAASSLSVKVRTASGWSRWTAVPIDPDHAPDAGAPEATGLRRASDPVWAGEATAVRYLLHARGHVRDLRLAFLNTKGTARASDRRGGRAQAARARPIVPAPGAPPIVTRAEWGASKCPPRAVPAYGEVKLAFIHHTVSANDYLPSDSAAIVRAMCLYHRNSNGWNDIGYNFLVDKYGQVFEGRAGGIDAAVVGAQAQGYNAQSTGIANIGTFSTTPQTPAGLDALARLLSWKLAVHGVPPVGKVQVTSTGGSLNRYPAGARVTLDRISGHRDGDATACPGDGLYSQLAQLRQMVIPGPLPVRPSLAAGARSLAITYGSKAELHARLSGPGGAPLAGLPLDIQLLGRLGSWKTLHGLVTDASGAIATRIRIAYNHAFRVRFAGGAGFGPVQSKPIAVGVRPRVSARLDPATSAVRPPGSRVVVRGKVKPAKRRALLLVERVRSDGARRRVARRVVAVRGGRARASVRLTRRGSYVLRLAVLPDAKNIGGRSKAVAVTIG